ncbi:hypothetical protein GGR56DRAFT_308761 [Xylariaceae sp. FL0804]|nr:hypothetical protein GGR56DRAFT_308761 [Xylariaceae sp. FL0804]
MALRCLQTCVFYLMSCPSLPQESCGWGWFCSHVETLQILTRPPSAYLTCITTSLPKTKYQGKYKWAALRQQSSFRGSEREKHMGANYSTSAQNVTTGSGP